MALKQYKVGLTVAFISANEQDCKEDAENFNELLSGLLPKLKRKTEEISMHHIFEGPTDAPEEAEEEQSLKAARP